ncbi:MAG TPA: response regulator [Candidatus Binataceae bacterium]|nr:response regulator [Candidatus Binataceae bacterium]
MPDNPRRDGLLSLADGQSESLKPKIAIVDDDAGARKALARLIASAGYATDSFASAAELLASAGLEQFNGVVADLRMPVTDGLELQRALGERDPALAVVIITGHADIPASVSAMKAGAVDFLEKPARAKHLQAAIARMIEHTQRQRQSLAAGNDRRTRYETLTPREREVFALVAAGLLNKQAAAHLGITEKTVKQHRARVMAKMKAESVADLAVLAEALGARPSVEDLREARGLSARSDSAG